MGATGERVLGRRLLPWVRPTESEDPMTLDPWILIALCVVFVTTQIGHIVMDIRGIRRAKERARREKDAAAQRKVELLASRLADAEARLRGRR